MLTLFGMVLAIGILVDDAIVVVENVERIMSRGRPVAAGSDAQGDGQITGAIIGITLVLMSVFVPMAFFPGSVGIIYRQFSVTMIAAIGFSALLALSLTPALCATMLKPVAAGHHHAKRGLFGWFNRRMEQAKNGYRRPGRAGRSCATGRFMLIYRRMLVGVGWRLRRACPAAFCRSTTRASSPPTCRRRRKRRSTARSRRVKQRRGLSAAARRASTRSPS